MWQKQRRLWKRRQGFNPAPYFEVTNMLTQYEAKQTFPKIIEIKHPKYIGRVIFTLEDVVFNSAAKTRCVNKLKKTYFTKVVFRNPKSFPLGAYAIYKKPK
jgi:hypothetical protein